MTEDQVIQCTRKIKGLFPMTTDEQVKFWTMRFTHFDFVHADAAIDKFADKHGDFVDRPGLLELIYAEQRRGKIDNRAVMEEESRKASASWEEIDAYIADCTDADLSDLKSAALSASRKLNDGAKVMLEKMDPRQSKTLRWLIFQYVKYSAHAA